MVYIHIEQNLLVHCSALRYNESELFEEQRDGKRSYISKKEKKNCTVFNEVVGSREYENDSSHLHI
jgi:hypothetical protein